MSSALERLHECENLVSEKLKAFIIIGRSAIYLAFMVLTLIKYGRHLVGLNWVLLISWGAEAIFETVLYSLALNGIKHPRIFYAVWYTFSTINFLVFFGVMFKLKSLQIYMDEQNETVD